MSKHKPNALAGMRVKTLAEIDDMTRPADELVALRDRVRELEAALRKIDELADTQPSYWIVQVLQLAQAALAVKPGSPLADKPRETP